MEEKFRSYLSLMDSLRDGLAQLTELAGKKKEAVRRDDLMALDGVIRQEQAIAMSFRGLEQRREKLHGELGMGSRPLSGVPSAFPEPMRQEARRAVEALQQQYKIYNAAARVARDSLEISLHEIEQAIAAHGGRTAEGAGYAAREAEPPAPMKTDFRA